MGPSLHAHAATFDMATIKHARQLSDVPAHLAGHAAIVVYLVPLVRRSQVHGRGVRAYLGVDITSILTYSLLSNY